MRMTYMYYLIKKNYEILKDVDFNIENEKDFDGSLYACGKFYNWLKIRPSLVELSTVDSFSEEIQYMIFFMDEKSRRKDGGTYYSLEEDEYRQIKPLFSSLIEKLHGVIQFCEANGFNAEQKGFDIKIPQTTDFYEYSEYINTLKKVFQQCPYLNVENEKISLQSTDIGSIWLKFAIIATGSSIVLSNLAAIVDKCVKIKSHILSCKQQEEQLKCMHIKNELLKDITDKYKAAFKEDYEFIIQSDSELLQEELGQGRKLSFEDFEKLKMSLKNISELMSKGMEIYASIDTPDEIKDVFPTSNNVYKLEEIPKLTNSSLSKEE